MSLTLKFSLFMVLVVFIILSTVTVGLVTIRIKQIQQQLIEKDLISSVLLSRELSDSFADYYFYQYDTYREFVRTKLNEYSDVVHFSMYNTSGEKLFDSNDLQAPQGSTPKPVEKITDPILTSLIADKQQQHEVIQQGSQKVIRVMQPYIDKFDVYRNMFEIEYSMKAIDDTMRQTIIFSGGFLAIFTVISLATSYVLVSQITKPVKRLISAAENFSQGNLDVKLEASSNDEIGKLTKAFTHMAADLKISHSKLESQNQILEEEVTNRTKELKEKIAEMERLQKLTVDRELKMIEMKKELDAISSKTTNS